MTYYLSDNLTLNYSQYFSNLNSNCQYDYSLLVNQSLSAPGYLTLDQINGSLNIYSSDTTLHNTILIITVILAPSEN